MSRIASPKKSRIKNGNARPERSLDRQTHLWMLRILVPLQGHRKFIDKDRLYDDDIARALGLDDWVDMDEEDFDPRTVLRLLRAQHEAAEQEQAEQNEDDSPLRRNLDRLAPLMGLTAAERTILEFTALQANDALLSEAMEFLGSSLGPSRLYRTLGSLLDPPAADIQAALSSNGRLVRRRKRVIAGAVESVRPSQILFAGSRTSIVIEGLGSPSFCPPPSPLGLFSRPAL